MPSSNAEIQEKSNIEVSLYLEKGSKEGTKYISLENQNMLETKPLENTLGEVLSFDVT